MIAYLPVKSLPVMTWEAVELQSNFCLRDVMSPAPPLSSTANASLGSVKVVLLLRWLRNEIHNTMFMELTRLQ